MSKARYNAMAMYDRRRRELCLFATRPIAKRERVVCDRHVRLWDPCGFSDSVRNNFAEVREAPGKGRGMFAVRPIKRRTVIECFPAIVITREDSKLVEKTALIDYIHDWGYGHSAMPLGLWALHNTTRTGKDTTADQVQCYADRTVTIYARKDIRPGEELTIPYTEEGIAEMAALGQLV